MSVGRKRIRVRTKGGSEKQANITQKKRSDKKQILPEWFNSNYFKNKMAQRHKIDSIKQPIKQYNSYDALLNGSRDRLKTCSNTSDCNREILLQLYNANVLPLWKNNFNALDRAKLTKEIDDVAYTKKKLLLTGRMKENEHVILNIFNRNNYDTLPIPDELKNERGVIRTELNKEKNISEMKDWTRAFEECLYFYIKSATNELYETYDCKMAGPTVFRPKKTTNFFGRFFTNKKKTLKKNKTIKNKTFNRNKGNGYKNKEWYKKAKQHYEGKPWFAQLSSEDFKEIIAEQHKQTNIGVVNKSIRDTAVRLGILVQDPINKMNYSYVANKENRNPKGDTLFNKLGSAFNKQKMDTLSSEHWSKTEDSPRVATDSSKYTK